MKRNKLPMEQMGLDIIEAGREISDLEKSYQPDHYSEKKHEISSSSEVYLNIIEYIEEGYYEIDLHGNFTFVNESLCRIFGYGRDELIGKRLHEFDNSKDHKRGYKTFNRVFKTGISTQEFNWEIIRKDREKRDVEISISLIADPDDEKPIGFRGILRDVTGRKKAEHALYESEARFRVLVEESPLAISLMNKDNQYVYLNPKFIEMFGYTLEDIPTGREWLRKAYPEKDYRNKVINEWLDGLKEHGVGEARPQTYDVRCKDGIKKVIHFRSVMMETGEQINFCEDVTDQKNLEAQLMLAQKVESLGTLAGGMAHNFNNILMAIQGNSSLMLLETDYNHPHYTRLQNIEKLVRSGSKLTHQLLGYARKGKYQTKQINLNRLIIDTSETFGMARKEIRIGLDLTQGSCGIIADQGQIEQVLLNLFVNAADAMPDGGSLLVETSHVNSEKLKGKPYNPKKGEYILLKVSDTGVGMDSEIIERIFDPFFTTKGPDRGTGLGLASVYGIIKSHAGFIDVYSEKGNGTSFHILFPRVEEDVIETVSKKNGIIKGMGTILLVEDEHIVSEVCMQYLNSLGYNVLRASGGKEAIQIYKTNKEEVDLIILDMIMPDMGGGETYDIIKLINPNSKVILSSGYSIEGQATEIMARGCDGFIQKPFDRESLSQTIGKVMGY